MRQPKRREKSKMNDEIGKALRRIRTHGPHDFTLFHGLEGFRNSISDLDSCLFELFSGSAETRILFDTRG
jgi:hypothetical protein